MRDDDGSVDMDSVDMDTTETVGNVKAVFVTLDEDRGIFDIRPNVNKCDVNQWDWDWEFEIVILICEYECEWLKRKLKFRIELQLRLLKLQISVSSFKNSQNT